VDAFTGTRQQDSRPQLAPHLAYVLLMNLPLLFVSIVAQRRITSAT
jgi:hypothetical protein